MARSKRRNPASGATAAAAAAAPPGDPSPPNDGAPPHEPAPVQCLCGDEHTGTYAPHWSGMEYTRLVEVFCDESMRDAVGRLGSGRTREAIDANVEDPFVAMARLYNSASFKPDNMLPAVAECAAIQPGNLRFHHTRTLEKLKEKYKELKKNISVVQGNYEKSGQNDPDKTEADFTDDKPLLYCWLRLDAAGFLEDFGTRRLPGDIGAERTAALLPATTRRTQTRWRRRCVRRRRRNAGAASQRARRRMSCPRLLRRLACRSTTR